jgi:hypothetical protein
MKKIPAFLPALALIASVLLSAFTQPKEQVDNSSTTLHWFVDPANTGSYQGANTQSAEEAATLCDSDGAACEYGFLGTQLVIDNQPSSGVEEDERDNGVVIQER